MVEIDDISQGDTVVFTPKGGSEFPTGERTRRGVVEAVRNGTVIVRQTTDDYTERIANVEDRIEQVH